MIEIVAKDAIEFGVSDELSHARTIVDKGTSAHRQLETYKNAIKDGSDEREALYAVVDGLIEDTMYGITPSRRTEFFPIEE